MQVGGSPVYPAVTESYLHGQKVQSQFKKHANAFRYVCFGVILLAILFGLFQALRTGIAGVYKVSVLSSQQAAVEKYYQETLQENRLLKDRISVYSAPAGIEELARNNLEMVGKDEILVRSH
jgi:cell division protein FtsB